MPGFDSIQVPVYCFLVSHGGRHVLFDLGVRRDWDRYAPSTVELIHSTTQCQTEKNVAEILDEYADSVAASSNTCTSAAPAVCSTDIEAVIWSHPHFDHIGDPSTFPASTTLVVGPGVPAICWPGYPSRADAMVLDADIAGGRRVEEVDFTASPLTVGRFAALDYFGDGSFYLLDSPGHSVGHMTALARVTAGSGSGSGSPDSFVYMGADACHHAGLLRPSPYQPLPRTMDPSPFGDPFGAPGGGVCLGEMVRAVHRHGSGAEPFFEPSPVLFPDLAAARDTVAKIVELDASEDVFVILAHDGSLRAQPNADELFFPRDINGWRARGWRYSFRWSFCRDFAPALSALEAGRAGAKNVNPG